jgi:hypothetical protein
MRLGFFGDSYIDVQHAVHSNFEDKSLYTDTWSAKLLSDLNKEVLSTGFGGSSIYYAVSRWKEDLVKYKDQSYDYAIFTFTWDSRLYTDRDYRSVYAAMAEKRDIDVNNEAELAKVLEATKLYYEYIHNDEQSKFNYELTLKWILDLPAQHPETKFIFLPCTEFARSTALKYFQNGTLLNFSFETLSNLESGSPCTMPCMCNRSGHLNEQNNTVFKDLIKHILFNYTDFENKVIDPDFTNFDLTEIPKFNR